MKIDDIIEIMTIMNYIVANLIFWPIWASISAIPYLLVQRAIDRA